MNRTMQYLGTAECLELISYEKSIQDMQKEIEQLCKNSSIVLRENNI